MVCAGAFDFPPRIKSSDTADTYSWQYLPVGLSDEKKKFIDFYPIDSAIAQSCLFFLPRDSTRERSGINS